MSFIDPILLSDPLSPVPDDGYEDPPLETGPLATVPAAQHYGPTFYPNDGFVDMTCTGEEIFDVVTSRFLTENSGSSLEFPDVSGSTIPTMPIPPTHPTKEKHNKSKRKHGKRKDKERSSGDGDGDHGGGKGKSSRSKSSPTTHPVIYPPILPTTSKPTASVPDYEPEAWSDDAEVDPGDLIKQQRNRISASKSRKKRTAEVKQLVEDERSVSQQRNYLAGYASQLQAEVYDLNCRLLEHRDCECALIRQYYQERRRRESVASQGTDGEGES